MSSRLGLIGFLFVLVLPVVACSATPATPASPASPATPTPLPSSGQETQTTTRTSDGGQVTVVASWVGPAGGAVFDVALDTHSVDLDTLDLTDAVLRNDRGEMLTAQPWSAPAGGHHRAGLLSFAGDATPFLASAKWIELVLSSIGDLPQRTLRWEIEA